MDGRPDWWYESGVAGTVNVPVGSRVQSISCVAGAEDATMKVGALDPVLIPATRSMTLTPEGREYGPVDIVFTGTVSFVVELLT